MKNIENPAKLRLSLMPDFYKFLFFSTLKLDKNLSVMLAITAFLSAGTVIRYLIPNFVFFFYILILTVSVFLLTRIVFYNKIYLNLVFTICFFMLYVFWVSIPFRPYENSFALGVLSTFFLCVLFYLSPRMLIFKTFTYFRFIIAIISLFASLLAIFLLAGIDIPYIELGKDFDQKRYYHLYLIGSASLTTNMFEFFGGSIVLRSTSLFLEPGHFGIICAFTLAVNSYRLDNWQDWSIFIGGILSFSLAFYFMAIIGFICYQKPLIRTLKLITTSGGIPLFWKPFLILSPIITSFIFTIFYFSSDDLFYRFFQHFKGLINLTLFDYRLGITEELRPYIESFSGMTALTGYGMELVKLSNLWGHIYRFGLIGLMLLIASIGSLFILGCNRTHVSCLSGFVFIVYLHRSWMLTDLWLLMLLGLVLVPEDHLYRKF